MDTSDVPAVAVVKGNQPVCFKDYGGPGPAVFMLHSFLMDHEMFAPQVVALRDRFRLIGVDARGHAGTPGVSPFDYWDVARDVIGLMDLLEISRAAVIGTSQGGFIAMRAALTAPERIGALCLLGTSAAPEAHENIRAYREIVSDWALNGAEKHLDTVATLSMGGMDADEIKARWRNVDGAQLVINMEALVSRDGLLSRLGEIVCPTVVLHGTADGAYPVARAEEIVANLGGHSELVQIDGGAHYLSLTDSDAVNPYIERFLDTRWAPLELNRKVSGDADD